MYLPYVAPPMSDYCISAQQLQDSVNAMRNAAMNWMRVVHGQFDRSGAEQLDRQMAESTQCNAEEPWRCRLDSLLCLL